MVASIGKIASPSQGVAYFERDGGDERIVEAHDRAMTATLDWIEAHAVETRMRGPVTRAMVRAGGQGMVAATFRQDTSRNLDPQLHTHAVIANMVQGEDGKWRTMVDDGLFGATMAIGAIYRAALARSLGNLGYGIEKTHPDGRFEIGGVPREAVEAFSTRRQEIEAAMAERGMGGTTDSPHLAARAALMTRAAKRDVVRGDLARAEMTRASSYGVGDTVIFSRQYKTLGVERGDERRAAAVDTRLRGDSPRVPGPDGGQDRGGDARRQPEAGRPARLLRGDQPGA